jgi:hypothetical protein
MIPTISCRRWAGESSGMTVRFREGKAALLERGGFLSLYLHVE